MCRSFFCFTIRATLTIVVVERIELDPSNNPVREGLHLPTYGPLTKKVAHPCCSSLRCLLGPGSLHQQKVNYFQLWPNTINSMWLKNHRLAYRYTIIMKSLGLPIMQFLCFCRYCLACMLETSEVGKFFNFCSFNEHLIIDMSK